MNANSYLPCISTEELYPHPESGSQRLRLHQVKVLEQYYVAPLRGVIFESTDFMGAYL